MFSLRLRTLLPLLALFFCAHLLAAETFYVRTDGGTRFSANAKQGQCDGKGDAAYPGSGVNRHCAFGDFRYLYDDRASYGKLIWAIAGGDTVIVRKHMVHGTEVGWRVGFEQNKTSNDPWCFGGNGTASCNNPTFPAGTAAQHTRILGENFGHCEANSSKTEVFGGYGLGTTLNLLGAQYVEVQCLNLTRHSDCVIHGDPPLPKDCSRSSGPIDDFASNGIGTDVHTHDVLLKDLWIHGFVSHGIIGPIGGLVIAERVDIAFNGEAGWDLDDGHSTASVNGNLRLLHSIVEWSGCNQQYPAVDPIPVSSCYGQSSGGYGDGVGTPVNMGLDVEIDHSIFRYNTQDGEDLGHVDSGSHKLRVTNSLSYGNGGGQFKWGGNFTSVVFENNVAIGNCRRMSAPLPGAPAAYNAHLADFCRALDAVSFNFRDGAKVLFANNTIVSYAPTTLDINCWDKSCANSLLVFENNIVRGYDNPGTYNSGGSAGGAGGFFYGHPIGKVVRTHNILYGLRNEHCQATELCIDPKFVNEPATFHHEPDLDHYDVHLAAGSPARDAGVPMPDIPVDFDGHPRTGKPSIGAMQ